MLNYEEIPTMLQKINNSSKDNIQTLSNFFGSLNYKDDSDQTLLHILVDKKYDEDKLFLAISALLENGLNPNAMDYFKYNFIQTALYTGYSEDFIIGIIRLALKYNLDVNHVDSDHDTIMHTTIYSDDYVDDIINIYLLLVSYGFKSNQLDKDHKNLVEALNIQNNSLRSQNLTEQYSNETIKEFARLFRQNIDTCENKLFKRK